MARSEGTRCGSRGGDVIPIDEPGDEVLRDMLNALPVVPLNIRNTEAMRGAYRAAVGPARAAGAAEERARIVAMMRKESASYEGSGMGLSSPALEKDFHAMALALRTMADRIERGEA